MFNEEIRQKLENFLRNKIQSSFNIGMCYMQYCNEYDDYGDEDFSDVCVCCNAARYENGVTKITLFYEELPNWVIKIPILGNYYEEEDCHSNYEESGSNKENDYCLTEVNYCNEAFSYGIENCIAKTYYICNINDVDFYCSEKVAIVYHDKYPYRTTINYSKPNSLQQAKSLVACYDSYLDVQELALFVDAYGELIAENLLRFLYDFDVTDLHHGNLGFDAQDNIKIIDCAGWRD